MREQVLEGSRRDHGLMVVMAAAASFDCRRQREVLDERNCGENNTNRIKSFARRLWSFNFAPYVPPVPPMSVPARAAVTKFTQRNYAFRKKMRCRKQCLCVELRA